MKRVRRSLRFSCGKGNLRSGISRIARAYGLVNERGRPHDSEIVRLLLVTSLTAGQPNRVATAVQYALAVQRPMLASELGRRITRRYATGSGTNGLAYSRGGKQSHEHRNQAKVTLDDFLADALAGIASNWQDEMGVVRDGKMVSDMASAGLADPDLPEILHWYVSRMTVLRQRLAQAEQWVAQIVDEAMSDEQPVRKAG